MNCTSTDQRPTSSIDYSVVTQFIRKIQGDKNDDLDRLSSDFTLNGI